MPTADIADDFSTPLTLVRLRELKAKWKVSMLALAMRAHGLGAISDDEYKRICIIFSRFGYRKHEPQMGLTPEAPAGVVWLAGEFARRHGANSPSALFLRPELFVRRYPRAAAIAGIATQEAVQ